MLEESKRRIRLGDLLVDSNLITQEQLDKMLIRQKKSGKKLGELLVDDGILTEEDIANALSQQLELPMVDLNEIEIDPRILNLVSVNILKKNVMIPFAFDENNKSALKVAMSNPLDIYAMEDIFIITNYQVEPVIATSRSIMLAIDRYYGQAEVKAAIQEYESTRKNETTDSYSDISEDVNSSPIVKLVKDMVENAVRQRASDIHIEPMEKYIRLRYRVDGALHNRAKYSTGVLSAIVARIKILSGMDIAEKRKPQDGRMTQIVDRVEYDIRVSVLPTVYGEKIVMRLATKSAITKEKSQLGLKPYELKQFDAILRNPHGIILVTGPTGSGKSTTLYTALSELNREEVNIVTVEDPVEANLNGINQIQVNSKAGLEFSTVLRSILRQDPDIIMIGEIRDGETAKIAVQASITGHLVLSTLHTNSSASTVIRLEDMGVESYLISDAVVGIIAQRLVRRLCPNCKLPREATEEELEALGVSGKHIIYDHCGCPACDGTGYKGRIGVYEIMRISPEIKKIISTHKGSQALMEQATKEGMRTLAMSAADYVLDGTTSIEEMMKVTYEE